MSFEYRMSILMMNLLRLLYHPLGLVMIKEGEFQNYLALTEETLNKKTNKMHSSLAMVPSYLGL